MGTATYHGVNQVAAHVHEFIMGQQQNNLPLQKNISTLAHMEPEYVYVQIQRH